MPGINPKPPKARALGAVLREVRETAGLSQRRLATKISRDQGVVSRWETGDRIPDVADVAQYLTALGIAGARYDEVVGMAGNLDTPRWVAITLPEQRAQLAGLLDLESTASAITDISPLLIPGLLQTRDYTKEIMAAAALPAEELSTRVAIRAGRRDVITRPDPASLLALIGEAALRQMIVPPELMARQLRYVLEMAERPNVDVRVLPFRAGWHPGVEGPFTLIEPRGESPVVHLEKRESGLFLHEEKDVAVYRQAVDWVLKAGMSAEDSAQLVDEVIKEMEQMAGNQVS
ncbi:MAG: helix-turn-helix domain-containing protein [Pseudonocardiaceae bacterium]|nr:helix-turn-helix domain-containing protein [Pseudonocardiaceae bacterium]